MKMKKTIPSLPVINIHKAVQFYQNRLNFECRHKEDGFAILVRDEAEIHLWAACDHGWKFRSIFLFIKPVWTGAESFIAGTSGCRIEVRNITDLYDEYKKQGVLYDSGTIIEKTSWGTLEFPALDLHRNLLTFYEQAEE